MDVTKIINLGEEINKSLTRILSCINNAADILELGADSDKDEMRESLEDATREIIKMAEWMNTEVSRLAGEVSADG